MIEPPRRAFDPWTATLAEAEAADQQGNDAARWPLSQWHAAQKLLAAQSRIVKGSGSIVLGAIAICAENGLPIPRWLGDAFLRRHDVVHHGIATSWDAPEAFGQPWPPDTRPGAVWRLRWRVRIVMDLVRELARIDPRRGITTLWRAFDDELAPAERAALPAEFLARVAGAGFKARTAQKAYKAAQDAGWPDHDALVAERLRTKSQTIVRGGRRKAR